ncbi:Uncharacterised protein [Weissella viridescens]|uniref:Uncharacterized protein n=1 Tax=Weissella viridescens TaxID=1629 RepID=A0A380P2I4_WEIVI|nr:Uncharacterised protein [Weissella viridescens]
MAKEPIETHQNLTLVITFQEKSLPTLNMIFRDC